MAIRSKIRDWLFPSKGDTFDNSYDYLLDFFNSLDSEFGGVAKFLFDYDLRYFFDNEFDMGRQAGNEGEFALLVPNGEIYMSVNRAWVKVDKVGRLPKMNTRDPNSSDILRYDVGDSWINSSSGQVFKFIGTIVVEENTQTLEAVWVNKDGNVQYQTDWIQQCLFYPKVNFSYRTKTQHMVEGELSFEDENLHLDGIVTSDGIIQYFSYDTHVDLYIQDFLVGTMELNREKVQTLMDMTYFNPEDGLPAQNDPDIYPWYARFERLMILLENSAQTDYNLQKLLRVGMNFSDTMIEMMEDKTTFDTNMTNNGYLILSDEDIAEMKEKYRSFFAALHFQEMSVPQKQWAMYLLGQCVAMESYDGNVYYIDGSEMLADGNIEPTC